MPRLKSLFSSSSQSPKAPPAPAPAPEMQPKNRGPSVVAKLMGLDMFPPENVAESKENVLVTKNAPKKASDHSQKQVQDEFQLRRSSHGGAECLQSIQLEELNKQLLAKHLQVMDELKEAKQRTDVAHKHQRRGLSTSTEYLDAMELLQVNRQFFEKYFNDAGVKLVDAEKKPSYFRNEQSSPRPMVERPVKTPEKRSQGGTTVVSYSHLRESATGEVLRSKNRNTNSKAVQKSSSGKDAKDIAKLIAKKIKESIAKEVVKTFSPKVDSAVSPRSSRASSPRNSSDGRKSSHMSEAKSPRSQHKPSRTPEPRSPRSGNGSEDVEVGPKKKSTSGLKDPKDGRKKATATAKAAPSTRSSSGDGSVKPAALKKNTQPSEGSPRVLQRHKSSSAEEDKAGSRVRSKQNPIRSSNPENGIPRKVAAVVSDKLVELQAEELRPNESSTQECVTTPAKIEQAEQRADVPRAENSPVSVLEASFDEEDVKEVILEPGYSCSKALLQSSQDDELVKEPDKNVFSVEGIACPPEKQEELLYLQELLQSSSLKLGREIDFKLDGRLFEKLEERYGDQELCHDRLKVHSSAVKRWLVFDVVNEVISTQGRAKVGREVLEEAWRVLSQQQLHGDTESNVVALVNSEMENWNALSTDTTQVCCQLEDIIFEDLLFDVITDL